MFHSLLRFTRVTAAEYSHSVFQEFTATSQGAMEIWALCTQYVYAADTMTAVLKLAHSVKYHITIGEPNQYAVAVTGGTLHTLSLTESNCSCSFRTLLMPCQHFFNVYVFAHSNFGTGNGG